MKKAVKKMLVFLIIAVALVTTVISIVIIEEKYSTRHYFDDWKSETNEDIVHIIGTDFVGGNFDVDLGKYVDGRVEEVYCIQNERIYFCYSTAVSDSYPDREWHIASVGKNGEDLIEHYSGNLFHETNPLGYSYEYLCLSYQSYNTYSTENYGGIYSDNKIYLHGDNKTVVYDIHNDMLSETGEFPICKYIWRIEEHEEIIIEDTEQSITKNLTLKSMAEKNLYAKKLLDLSAKKTWDGTFLTERVFSKLKVVDDRIYIICEVLNLSGESFAVVFRYDFTSDNVLYVSSQKVGDIVDSNYTFVEYEH